MDLDMDKEAILPSLGPKSFSAVLSFSPVVSQNYHKDCSD